MPSKLQKLFTQPYPEEEGLIAYLKGSVGVGLLIFGILYFLRPLGIDKLEPHVMEYSAYAGLVTFAVSLLFDLFVFYILKIDRDKPTWTFAKWLLSAFLLMFFIGIGNFALMTSVLDISLSWSHFGQAMGATLLVGMIPTFLVGAFRMGNALGRNQQLAGDLQPKQSARESKIILLPDQTGKDDFKISSDQILCVESMQNYVSVTFIQNGVPSQKILRTTMASLGDAFADTSIQRCHRSYFVNLDKIEAISGNAQGLKLQLSNLPGQIVPVSRKYLAAFKNL